MLLPKLVVLADGLLWPLFMVAPALKQSCCQLTKQRINLEQTGLFLFLVNFQFIDMAGHLKNECSNRHQDRKGAPGQKQGSINLSKVRWVGWVGLAEVNHETTPHGNLFRLQIRRNVLISLLIFSVYSGKIS